MADKEDSKSFASNGVRVRPPPPAPKNPRFLDEDFFIQVADLAYHRRAKCGAYHLAYGEHIITHRACIFLRLDYIQHYVLMIYRNALRMIYKAYALILYNKNDVMNYQAAKH